MAAGVTTVLCNIEVPQVVLGRDDCDPSLAVPQPCTWQECLEPAQARRRVNFAIPAETEPGCLLRLPLPDGATLELTLPPGLAPGTTATALEGADGAWLLLRRPQRFALCLAANSRPGDVLRLQLPDATVLAFEVPEGVAPGHLVELGLQGAAWSVTGVLELPEPVPRPPQSEVVRGPYAAMLGLLREEGWLQRLPVDGDGMLLVSAPFCGRFQEYCVLGEFLAEHCLTLPGVQGVRILAIDALDSYYRDWAIAARWFQKFHPRVELHTLVRDLAQQPLPEAGLVIGVHPEVTHGGFWFPVMGSVIRSGRKGLCVFATFYEDEMQTLKNMAEMYADAPVAAHVLENPYYPGRELPDGSEPKSSERLRHLMLLTQAARLR